MQNDLAINVKYVKKIKKFRLKILLVYLNYVNSKKRKVVWAKNDSGL